MIFFFISIAILFLYVINLAICSYFYNYYINERERKWNDLSCREVMNRKLDRIQMYHNKSRLLYSIISICIICICFFQMFIFIYSLFKQTVSDEKIDIAYSSNDIASEISEMFSRDDIIKKEESKSENSYQEALYFRLKGAALKEYRREFAGIYTSIGTIIDQSSSFLSFELKEKIDKYKEKINCLQNLKKSRKLTEEESFQEYRFYTDINNICNLAENTYQAARSAEDAFWAHRYSSEPDYTILLKYASYSISDFEAFYMYENHMVNVEEKRREVQPEELYYRNGKVHKALSQCAEDTEDKLHFYSCAYGCFRNVTVDCKYTNEWSLMGYYYLCDIILLLLSDPTLSSEEYQELLEEAETAFQNAMEIYEDIKTNPSNVQSDSGGSYMTEKGIAKRLKEIEIGIKRFQDQRLAKNTE